MQLPSCIEQRQYHNFQEGVFCLRLFFFQPFDSDLFDPLSRPIPFLQTHSSLSPPPLPPLLYHSTSSTMWRRIPATGARHSSSFSRRAAYATAGATTLALTGYYYNLKQRRSLDDDQFEYPPHSSMIYLEPQQNARDPTRPHAFWAPPSREEMIRMLQEGPGAIRDIIADKEKAVSTTPTKALDAPSPPAVTAEATNATPVPDSEADVFDLLIIGGGATGAGCAVDAATRGLKVAMVERDDFSSGKKIPPPSSLFLGGH